MTIARIWWAQNRRLALAFGVIATVGATIGIVWSVAVSCSPDLSHSACVRFLNIQPLSAGSMGLLAILPVFVGLVFGVEAACREIEDRTTAFAWFVIGSRRRWLIERVVPGVCATFLIAALCGGANAIVVANLNPRHDLPASFVDYGLWGPLVIVRALGAYAVGLLAGLLVGRVVPSLAVALLVAVIVLPAALFIGRTLEPTVILRAGDSRLSDGLGIEGGVLSPGGDFGQMTACQALAPADLTSEEQDIWVSQNCPFASKVIPGSQMPTVELREAGAVAAVALLSGGAALVMLASRRP